MESNNIGTVLNIDGYEREKLELTLSDAKHLVSIIENYLSMIQYCDENGIKIDKRTMLDKIRYPGQPAGPDNDLQTLSAMFERGHLEIARNITREQLGEIHARFIKPREIPTIPANVLKQIDGILEG